MISRHQYLDKLIEYENPRLIKIITGVRRAGKSSILMMYRDHIKKHQPEMKILYLNLESFENLHLRTHEDLFRRIQEEFGSIQEENSYCLLLDEIQLIEGWERVVNGLHATGRVNLVISGSNAKLLSSEIATLLSGRYVEIEVLPLSFLEYLDFKQYERNEEIDHEKEFQDFLDLGAFPAVVLSRNESLQRDYLQGLYDSIIVRDIVSRHQIKDITALHGIISFLFEMIGRPIEIKNVINTIKSAGGTTSYKSVNDYIEALLEAYVLYPVEMYKLKGKKRLVGKKRYYLVDGGLKSVVVPPIAKNIGSQLENAVYLELLRRGYRVYAGDIADAEIDFVAERAAEKMYIQVSLSLMNEATRAREFRSLESVKDNFPKWILTLDKFDFSQNGIQCINLIDWMLEEQM